MFKSLSFLAKQDSTSLCLNIYNKKYIICLSNVIGDSVGKSDSKQTLAGLGFLKKDKHHKILQTQCMTCSVSNCSHM